MSTGTPLAQGGSSSETAPAKMPDWTKGALGALGGVAAALITLLAVFNAISWSASQTALATTEAAAVVGFLSAACAHFWPRSKKEPVALGGTFTALVAATLALMSGFNVWKLTQDQIAALVGLVTALIGAGTAWFARTQVTAKPQKDWHMAPAVARAARSLSRAK